MISAPHTYSEWVDVIAILKNKTNDEEVLNAMRAGEIEWQSGVAERFSQKLIDAVNYRMNAASDKFQLDLSRAGSGEGAIVQAILALRKEMSFLAQVMNIQVLPEKERQHYTNLVIEQANTMQNSLEETAKSDRSGRLSSIIRNHKVNSF